MTRREFAGLLPAAALAAEDWTAGAGIQRTMGLLESGQPARILVYGQSITQQNWWKTVADDLKRRYPKSAPVVVNLAIGGYSTQFLRRTIVHDVDPFYPDLVIFHDYGREDQYEEMIAGIRSRTTSEVLLLNDHVTCKFDGEDAEREKRREREDKHSLEWMPALAKKYALGFCDIRRAWYRHIEEGQIAAKTLLRDSVHLNEKGEDLYAQVVKRALVRNAALPADATVRDLPVRWTKGRATVEFEGNRVLIRPSVAANGAFPLFSVLIDGKRPSAYPELYSITRPSNTWCVDWPSINRVSAQSPLVAEDWVLRCYECNEDGSSVRFHVIGSETGFDGEGTNTEKFVSRSGRVVIEPEDWVFKRAYSLRKIKMPQPFEVQWRVRPMFQDVWDGRNALLAQGLPNTKHRMELLADGTGIPPVDGVRVYTPPWRA